MHLELPYDEAISHLGIYPKGMKTRYWRDIYTPTSIAALVTTAKIQKQPHLTMADQVKMWTIYSAEYYEKEEILSLGMTRMDPEVIVLSEISQQRKHKYYTAITYMWNLKKGQTQTKKSKKVVSQGK